MAAMPSKLAHAQLQKAAAEAALLRKGPFDAQNELETTLFDSFTRMQMQLKPPFQLRSRSDEDLTQLNQALIYGILTQPQDRHSHVMHLVAVTRDGYAGFVSILLCLVKESYIKLLDQPREHLLWLVRQLITFAAAEVDTLCLSLLRCVVGGDTSRWNIWLAGQMLDVLRNNWSWLVEHPVLLTSALFVYLRLIPDHFLSKSPIVSEIRKDEVAFCVKILRDRFQDCLVIGRDLVRLLQDVAYIPEFKVIWKDLLLNPSSFNAVGFADIAQLYVVRTPTRYLTSRLTPEMEAQIRFMLTHVRMGSQLRYQAWFAHRYFNSPGSETLVCDVIRFICCVHHPTNEILQSDIVPRWALLGWLLKCCKSHYIQANAKLALFYDWLFFMRNTDNIMNVEPALLLMMYSIPKYTDITQSLLEFLFLCMEHYDPQRKDLIWCGVISSMDILVEKGVVQSLKPLCACPHLALSLKRKLNEFFPAHCHVGNKGTDGKPSLKSISKVHPVPVLVAQTPPSKELTPTGLEADCNAGDKTVIERERGRVGEPTRDAFGDTRGSSLGNKQDILVQEAISPCGLGNTRALELMSTRQLNCDTLDITCCKKRRLNLVTLDDLSKAMYKLREEAVLLVEEFLSLHLLDEGEVGAERGLKDVTNCSSENYLAMAKRFSSIIKGSNFQFFTPLQGHYSDFLEEDEIMSVTSAVLRRYTHSRNPGLLKMLFSWHAEGYAVGVRLLCYSCRLAEGTTSFGTSATLELKVENSNNSCQKYEKTLETDPEQDRKVPVLSALSWHQELYEVANKNTSTVQKAVGSVHTMEPQYAVMGCFMAYKEFLKGLKNKEKAARDQLVSMDNMLQKSLTEEQTAHELHSLLVKDLETCLSWSVPRLRSILPFVFSYLPDLSSGNEKVIRLLVLTVAPMNFSKLELKLSLKEISVFGGSLSCIQTLFKSSLLWECCEQQYFWRLLLAEWQNFSSLSLTEFVKYCKHFLKPDQHHEALSGLLSLLRVSCPTANLVSTVLDLPQGFNKLVAAVLATWTTMHTSRFLECFAAWSLERSQEEVVPAESLVCCLSQTESSLSMFLDFLNNLLETSHNNDEDTHMNLRKIQKILFTLLEKSHSKL